MNKFTEIQATELKDNPFEVIGKDWMLVTAGDKERNNTMTASWGAMGILFNKPVVTIFIRPQRYTYEFLEAKDEFTLSVLPKEFRNAMNICGKKSGRDCDKMKEAGIHPLELESGNIGIEEARLVLECKKIYGNFFNPDAFYDKANVEEKFFPNKDYHKVYIAEITKVWIKE